MKSDPADLATVFRKGNVTHLGVSYGTLMASAIHLRRNRIADSRAEAIENAYDAIIRSATDGKWRRVGEVHLNRKEGEATALCIEEDLQMLVGLS